MPGPLDAITDVPGVEVGHATLITGNGKLVVGKGPVRTGVTVVHPRGRSSSDPVFGAWFTLNGNGEMTGTTWLEESGILEGPIAITNTHSVGVVRDAILQWQVSRPGLQPWGLPVVAETYDGGLNDINGFHVKPEHVMRALDSARGGAVAEGNVGGGTGMRCHGFKGGIGTASRRIDARAGGWTVGVLVQCNYGARRELRVAGVPVGEEITDLGSCIASSDQIHPAERAALRRSGEHAARRGRWRRLHHHHRRHRRAAPAASAQAHCDARVARCRPYGRQGGEQLGRHLHRLFDRECADGRRHRRHPDGDAA